MRNINFDLPKERMITVQNVYHVQTKDLSTMGANALDSHSKRKKTL